MLLCNNVWGAERRLKGRQFKRKQTETNRSVFASHFAQMGRTAARGPTHTHSHSHTHTHWGAQTTLTSTHAHTQPFSLRPNGDPVVPLLRHTHTHASKPCPGRQQMYMWVICVLCVHGLLCVFVHTWICQHQCQGVGYCCLGPNPCHHPSPPSHPSQHMKRQAGKHSGDGGWTEGKGKRMERKREGKRKKNERRKKKGNWGGRIRQLFTAISGGQQQSKLRSLSASGGTIQFTFHLICHLSPPHTHTRTHTHLPPSFHLFQPKITDLSSSFHHKMCAV